MDMIAELTSDRPAGRQVEGHPIGNGRMGTLVWSTPGTIEFQINRVDVFAVNRHTAGAHFPGETDYCGGGALIDLGVYRLDLAMWLCGYPEPQWVLGNAFSKIEVQEYPDFELDDMSVAMIRMKNGTMLELEASWASNREGEECATRIYGTKGGLLIHDP